MNSLNVAISVLLASVSVMADGGESTSDQFYFRAVQNRLKDGEREGAPVNGTVSVTCTRFNSANNYTACVGGDSKWEGNSTEVQPCRAWCLDQKVTGCCEFTEDYKKGNRCLFYENSKKIGDQKGNGVSKAILCRTGELAMDE